MIRRVITSAVAAASLAGSSLVSGTYADGSTGPWLFDPHGSADHPSCSVPASPTVVSFTANDGVPITALEYRPSHCSVPRWKFPVIVDDSDYFESNYLHSGSSGIGYPPYFDQGAALVSHFAPLGFAVVKLESRGSGRSGGCHDDFGPASARDFAQVVDYYAKQPWTNGKVGSFGGSADGNYQNDGAVTGLRSLTTMIVMNAASSEYDEHAFDGVPYDDASLNGSLEYEEQTTGSNAGPTTDQAAETASRSTCRAQRDPGVFGVYPTGVETPYFVQRDYRRNISKISASVLYYAAFHDNVVLPIAIDGWYDRLPTFKRAIFSQLAHEPPFPGAYSDAVNPPDLNLMRTDWWAIFDAWFDYWLLDSPTGVAGWPAVQVQDEHNVWRAVPSFAGMGTTRPYSLGVGTLGQPAAANTTEQFAEAQQLTWDMTVSRPMHLSGQAHLVAPITLDAPNANFGLALEEIKPDGSITYLTRGYLAADHRNSLTSIDPAPFLAPVTYRIRTEPFDAWISAGSTLRLVLSGVDPVPATKTTDPTDHGETALPAGTAFVATMPVDGRSVLDLPIADDSCGLLIGPQSRNQKSPPTAPVPGCPSHTADS